MAAFLNHLNVQGPASRAQGCLGLTCPPCIKKYEHLLEGLDIHGPALSTTSTQGPLGPWIGLTSFF